MKQRMNPFMAYFYVSYLELMEFSTTLDLKLFDTKIKGMRLPPKIRNMAYKGKYLARSCRDRVSELKRMYALTYVDGYEKAKGKYDEFLRYEAQDPLRHTLAAENTGLFSSKSTIPTTIIERSGMICQHY